MGLTEHQLNFFHTFGFIHIPELFSPEEIAWITEEFENVVNTHGGGKGHDGSTRTSIVPTIDHSERLCTLLDDQRIVGIALRYSGRGLQLRFGGWQLLQR